MRILVTGEDGFTGQYFSQAAKKNQHDVIALKANLTDIKALNTELASTKPDAVVHLAAISFVGHDNADDFYKVNVVGTDNLLKAIAAIGTKPRVLIASSANIYGNPNIAVLSEQITPAPVNHYAASKLAMEHITRTWFSQLPIIITRPFNYTGVGQNSQFLIPKIVNHFKTKQAVIELGNTNISRDFSDVRDIADTYLALIESSISSETINVCSGKSISLKAIIAELNQLTGYEIQVKINPLFVRENDILNLHGDNNHLIKLTGQSIQRPFNETLKWMLNS